MEWWVDYAWGMKQRKVLAWSIAMISGVAGLGASERAASKEQPANESRAMFLVDDAKLPHVVLTWPTRSGGGEGGEGETREITLECDRAYRSPNEREYLARNLECFVALGGTRLDRGIGHPAGAILRVGFYKKDRSKPMFDDIADNGLISVRVTNVNFTGVPSPVHESALQHIKFLPDDLADCGLGGESVDQFNTVSATDDLVGKITLGNGRLGALDVALAEAGKNGKGSIETIVEADGSVTFSAKFPYGLLRHVKDPWKRSLPGTFTEPQHFHIEIEVLPKDVADAEARDPSLKPPKPKLRPPAPPPAPKEK